MHSISILGCGWLGLSLGSTLVNYQHHVCGSTTRLSRLSLIAYKGIKPYLVDLNPLFSGDASFFEADILVVNLPPRNQAGDPHFHRKQLETVRDCARKGCVKRIIFVSSTAVYPDLNRVVHENDADKDSLSRSGISLLEMENIFKEEKQFQTTVIRFGGLYGPDRHPGRFLRGKSSVPGANNPVNVIHRDDCIAIIKSIIDNGVWGETLNACSPNKVSRKEFYSEAAKEIQIDPPTFSKEPQPYKDVSPKKLINLLNYHFIH